LSSPSTTTATAESTTAGATLGSLVDTDGAAIEPEGQLALRALCALMHALNVVHGIDGCLRISLLAITDEAEATAAASVTVLDDNLREPRAISLERF